jgi:hypothetical protein
VNGVPSSKTRKRARDGMLTVLDHAVVPSCHLAGLRRPPPEMRVNSLYLFCTWHSEFGWIWRVESLEYTLNHWPGGAYRSSNPSLSATPKLLQANNL